MTVVVWTVVLLALVLLVLYVRLWRKAPENATIGSACCAKASPEPEPQPEPEPEPEPESDPEIPETTSPEV